MISASGFIVAWAPFSILCIWEIVQPPPEIPTGKTSFIRSLYSATINMGEGTSIILKVQDRFPHHSRYKCDIAIAIDNRLMLK
jgi:hypothetical protein